MLSPKRENIHQTIQWVCLLLMAVGLPLSMFLMSISSIFLFANWLFWGNPLRRIRLFVANKSTWVFTLIFLLHVVGVLYSTDLKFALDDLRIKLPLLIYPLVLGSTPQLSTRQYKLLFYFFVSAVMLSTAVGFCIYMGWAGVPVSDFRDLSPFISHIRLSLLVCVAIAWLVLSLAKKLSIVAKIGSLMAVFWLVFFLNILQSATGFIILSLLLILFAIQQILSIQRVFLRWLSFIGIIIAPITWISLTALQFFSTKDPWVTTGLETKTINGREYHHNFNAHDSENGHYVFQFICEDELRNEWPKRSHISIDSVLTNGFPLRSNLWRYMSSKNLRKDSVGVWQLSPSDVKAIENGEVNCNYTDWAIKRRLYGTLQELDGFLYGTVNGSSLAQRILYFKTGLHIAKENLAFGVGTGDLKLAFSKQYELENSPLAPEYRLRAHNQYLSILIAFGLPGLILFLTCLLLPAYYSPPTNRNHFIAFLTIALVSFLSEDTLETQAGVSFFIFFYGLLIWAKPEKNF